MPRLILLKKGRRDRGRRDARRGERQAVYNDPRYKELRAAKRQNDPLCEICLLRGRTVPADQTHHWRTFVGAGASSESLAFDYFNLASLCRACHNEIHNGRLRGCSSLEDVRERLRTKNEEDTSL